MWKTTIGMVAGLALFTGLVMLPALWCLSTAWATEQRDERGGSESAPVQLVDASAAGKIAESGRGSEAATPSDDVRASRDDKASRAEREKLDDSWLQMREGYRDGGY